MSKQKNKSKNREIKFRVWNSKKNSFITNYMKTPHVFGIYNGLFNTFDSPEGFIYSQYTGLIDKEGNEIYEGDILNMNGETEVCVSYEDGSFGAKFNNHKYCKEHDLLNGFYSFRDNAFYIPFGKNQLACWEITGNIYEKSRNKNRQS